MNSSDIMIMVHVINNLNFSDIIYLVFNIYQKKVLFKINSIIFSIKNIIIFFIIFIEKEITFCNSEKVITYIFLIIFILWRENNDLN